jgi:hypothetical protein
MGSPTLELTDKIVGRLKAWPALTAIVGNRVYDHVPPTPVFPYVALGTTSETQADADCLVAMEVGLRIDGWSRAIGKGEVLRIADAIRAALHRYEPELADNALVFLEWMRTDGLRDPDGLTSHSVSEFRAVVEQP